MSSTKPKSKGISTAARKAKGRNGQQEIRDLLLERFPELEGDDLRSTAMGQSGVDLLLSPKAKKLLPISPEVKRRKTFAAQYDQIAQAERGDGLEPVVFFRGDRKPWLVILPVEVYLDLLRKRADSESL